MVLGRNLGQSLPVSLEKLASTAFAEDEGASAFLLVHVYAYASASATF